MSTFRITAEMLNGYCQQGLTVKEMAETISNQSGIKCSVGQIRKACEHYNISLKAKPRKSAFLLDDVAANTQEIAEFNEGNTVMDTVGTLEMA